MTVEWRRYVLEGGTIVLSILLALFFDASWDDYQDRVRERASPGWRSRCPCSAAPMRLTSCPMGQIGYGRTRCLPT